jgi:hypothetical protein
VWVLALPFLILVALALFSGAREPKVAQGDSVVREAQPAR